MINYQVTMEELRKNLPYQSVEGNFRVVPRRPGKLFASIDLKVQSRRLPSGAITPEAEKAHAGYVHKA